MGGYSKKAKIQFSKTFLALELKVCTQCHRGDHSGGTIGTMQFVLLWLLFIYEFVDTDCFEVNGQEITFCSQNKRAREKVIVQHIQPKLGHLLIS